MILIRPTHGKLNSRCRGTLPLFLCALDDSLWLSEDEAVAHVLEKHFATFYQTERTPTDPPKGTYTFVAQCGMSGAILGPPNYHDYQNQLRKLHAERYSRMPFEEMVRIHVGLLSVMVVNVRDGRRAKTKACRHVRDTCGGIGRAVHSKGARTRRQGSPSGVGVSSRDKRNALN